MTVLVYKRKSTFPCPETENLLFLWRMDLTSVKEHNNIRNADLHDGHQKNLTSSKLILTHQAQQPHRMKIIHIIKVGKHQSVHIEAAISRAITPTFDNLTLKYIGLNALFALLTFSLKKKVILLPQLISILFTPSISNCE